MEHFLTADQEKLAASLMTRKPRVEEIEMAIGILDECRRRGWVAR